MNAHVIGRRADQIVSVSESVRRQLIADGVSPARVRTIPNAVVSHVALDRGSARAQLKIDQHAWTIGMVAGLRPEKAHVVALESLADARLAASNVRLCVVGSGPCEGDLRRQAVEIGVADRVDWIGSVPDHVDANGVGSSAGAAYSAAFDAALVCSDWEGLPLFALEAMAASTPVIASSVGELPHLLRDGGGLLVPPRDPGAVAQAVATLETEPALARSMGRTGERRIASEHSSVVLTASLERLYDEMLEQTTRLEDAA
jgi:glycosyltransferase involved in cell wall biosynthesis